MAVNPLIVFVGLSVTTLAGLVVVQQTKNQPSKIPVVVERTPLVIPEPQIKTTETPVPEKLAPEKPVTKLASLPPKQKIEAKAPTAPKFNPPQTRQEKKQEAKPDPVVSGVVAPTFDIVRIEEDGGAVVVGKAAPGADVSLKLNGKVIGTSKANDKGDWVFVPDQLVPKGSHELIVEATGKNKKTVRSKQSIFIAMPDNAKDKPLIVVSKADAPTRVLQTPDAVPVFAAPALKTQLELPPKLREKMASLPTPQSAPVLQQDPKAAKASKLPTGDTKIQPGGDEVVVSTPPETVAPQTLPVKKDVAPVTVPDKLATPTKSAKLTFGTVDYNDRGDIVFSGKATAGKTIRLYVDNQFVGESVVGKDGNWVFRGREQIKTGTHELRADQVDVKGKVAQRTAVPFVRADPVKVAALLSTRKPTKLAVSAEVETPAKVAKAPVVVKTVAVEKTPQPVKEPVKTAKAVTDAVIATAQAPATTKAPALPAPQKQAAITTPAPVKAAAPPAKPTPPATPARVATNQPKKEKPELVAHVVIQPGNNLWNISRVIYGKGIAYTTIYQANKKQIKNPHRIYPGQILTTPGATSTGSIEPDQREPLNAVIEKDGVKKNAAAN